MTDQDAVRVEQGSVAVRRGRGRRPSELVRRQVLAAAGQLLLAEGMAGFTIERVAALAGASKMTIYKWWPSKGALALDGYFTTVGEALTFPDTGDAEADLTTVRQDVRRQGELAARLLVDGLAGREQAAATVLPTQLVIRGTTGRPRVQGTST